MLKKLFLSTLTALSLISLNAQTVNTEASKINFTVKNMAFNRVEGTFTGMQGQVYFNPNDITDATMEVCIDASTVNTGNESRDHHLKNEDFFAVETYPNICIEANEFKKYKDGFIAIGKLTMHGITQSVEIPFTYENLQIIADFKLKRKDYKVGEKTGNFMVGNEIEIHIQCALN